MRSTMPVEGAACIVGSALDNEMPMCWCYSSGGQRHTGSGSLRVPYDQFHGHIFVTSTAQRGVLETVMRGGTEWK